MKWFERELMQQLLKWLDRKEIFAIKGPRQSGKTTLLKMLKEQLIERRIPQERIVLLNFEDKDILERFVAQPKSFIESFIASAERHFFLLDEYQYVKEGGQKLKLLYDSLEQHKFIITGSSSLEIADSMAKFLVGRVFFFELLPFNFHEFLTVKDARLAKIYQEKHNLIKLFIQESRNFETPDDIFTKEFIPFFDEWTIFGGYPEVIKSADAETKQIILKNIYATYISKDIVELLRITDSLKYRGFVRAIALIAGNFVDYSKLAAQCKSYYKEIKHWLSVLAETYIIKIIRPFYKNPLTELKKNPKIYFHDLGLKNYLINNFNSLNERADAGTIAENAVLLQLMYTFPDADLSYWRTIAKAEVDFVLRLGAEIVPIEVKYQPFMKAKVSRSFRSFIRTYKPKKALVITKDYWGELRIDSTIVKFIPVCYL